jgi:hypothetical protein
MVNISTLKKIKERREKSWMVICNIRKKGSKVKSRNRRGYTYGMSISMCVGIIRSLKVSDIDNKPNKQLVGYHSQSIDVVGTNKPIRKVIIHLTFFGRQ